MDIGDWGVGNWELSVGKEEEAMPEVGIRELKAHASEIIRRVRERQARYVFTHHGRPVELLVPLGEEIGRDWRSPLTSSELLSDMRR